jgi:tRNA threonylcarbamoyladenosine biosynthesis protein TsaB
VIVLAVDTTHERGSVALATDNHIDEVALHAPTGFAHVLYPELDRLLQRNTVKLPDVNCFAAASGPGSFTGVRIGLACVKGLAEAVGRPAVAVSNLEALATFGSAPLRAAVLDARRGEVYGGVYNASGLIVAPEVVMKLEDWLATLPAGDIEFITAHFPGFRQALAAATHRNIALLEAPEAQAGAIARIAIERLATGSAQDPAALDANYVRRSDAELFWRE